MDEVSRVILGLDQVIRSLDFDLRYHEKFGFIKLSFSCLSYLGAWEEKGSWLIVAKQMDPFLTPDSVRLFDVLSLQILDQWIIDTTINSVTTIVLWICRSTFNNSRYSYWLHDFSYVLYSHLINQPWSWWWLLQKQGLPIHLHQTTGSLSITPS